MIRLSSLVGTRPMVKLALGIQVLVLGMVIAGQTLGAGPLAAHLNIRNAGIVELGPGDPADVPNRPVALAIDLAGAPVCTSSTGFLAYGFFIDADDDPNSGVQRALFEPLGVDARITAQCDPNQPAFTSPVGPVSIDVDSDTGFARLQIQTTVGMLPAIEFRWFAYAEEDTTFVRLPAPGEAAEFVTLEKTP